jgi:hypothetical protein
VPLGVEVKNKRKMEEKMNPHTMNMIVKQKQAEIRRQVAMQRRLDRVDKEYKMWMLERSILTVMSLLVPLSILSIFILM